MHKIDIKPYIQVQTTKITDTLLYKYDDTYRIK